MEPIDKNYLRLQFWNKIYEKNATEFQGFFEDIMQKAFSDFQKIRPYGKQGDGGNDGYRPTEGIYYQVYAPKNPNEKEVKAAQKLKEDFEKLKTSWDQISKIKTFYFVFNDKGSGSTIVLEKALSELKNNNESIEFSIFTPKDLEGIFFTLKNDEILALGFDVDVTKSFRIAKEYLDKIEVDLDREYGKSALKALENFKDIFLSLQDENLQLTYEILKARTLQKLERIKEAKEKYESLCKIYPNDPRAFLYLAEFYLNNDNFEKNEELLKQAEAIDSGYWLLELEKLIREYRLGNQIDVTKIDEQIFPSDPRVKSHFYRLYSFFLERSGNQTKADSFIERAIHFNPKKFNNHDAKLSILEGRIFSQNVDKEKLKKDVEGFLAEIEAVEQKVVEWSDLAPRNRAILNVRKLNILRIQENYSEFEKLAKETFELLLECYFDQLIDKIVVELLRFIQLPPNDFDRLLTYLQKADKPISTELEKMIFLQFNCKNTLFTEGRKYFEATNRKGILNFINDIENKNYDNALAFLKKDPHFAVAIAGTAKAFPELRRKIIESLPDDENIQKDKLWLLLNYDEKNIDEAFDLLKAFDLSNLSYFECRPILEIAQQKKAWDFVIKVLDKLLKYEKKKNIALQLKLQLFTANFDLERFSEVIRIGEKIVSNSDEMGLLNDQNKEGLLGQTILARLKRGEYAEAKVLMEKYPGLSKTFEFKIAIEAEVYLKCHDAHKALASVVEGIKIIKTPTPEQYGRLFIVLNEIDNMINISLTPRDKVETNCFVKLKDQERWYFVGDDDELDATKISSTDEKYAKFIDKEIGEKIAFENKYRSGKTEYTIENILPIEKYIFWQCIHHAQKLTLERRWDMMEMIEAPKTGETIDTKYLVARLGDERKKLGDVFDLYCQENIPLAFLGINEGGLINAIGRIVRENRGFVKFSSGALTEINQQKDVAKRIIGGEPFYIDGTSALVLSETDSLEKVYEYMPNLKVPQSVITMLFKTKERFIYMPGQIGHMSYTEGKLRFSSVDQEKRAIIQSLFKNCIDILESKPQDIVAISNANKADCLSEQSVPPELCDACILAQKDNVPVLTEDYLYLKANEFETKKKAPEYCSTFALIRTLYEQRKVTFDQYLNYFNYLSSYRFRFLPVTTDDIEKAVFGDGTINILQPERIRQFNFSLTLSQEYGVSFDKAFFVVGQFLIRVLVDDAILPEMAETIFAEILSTFPTDKDKKTLGKMFLRASVQTINKIRQRIIIGTRVQKKVNLLLQFTEIYGPINNLWTP